MHHEGDPAHEPCVFIASKAADGKPGLSESPRHVLRVPQADAARSAVKAGPRLPGSFMRCEGTEHRIKGSATGSVRAFRRRGSSLSCQGQRINGSAASLRGTVCAALGGACVPAMRRIDESACFS